MEKRQNLTFNTCLESDLVAVNRLAHIIWPPTFKDILSQDQLQFMLEWMYNIDHLKDQMKNGHLFYLLKSGTEEIGFVGLEPNFPELGTLRIHKIYLLPTHQGKGWGKWMMDEVEKVALANDLEKLHLNVNRYNKASEFYQKIGFEIITSEDIDIGNGYFMNDFVLTKVLKV
jgi:GNAT superfamily N-acetyltransferase